MVRLRKRSDWFLSPTLGGDGASPSLLQDSQCRSLADYDARHSPIDVQSSPLLVESSANLPSYSDLPPSYSDIQSFSVVPQLCINDSDILGSVSTSPSRQHHIDEGYSSRSAVGENSMSLVPTPVENSLSSPSPTTSTAANSRPNLSLESSPTSAKHLMQSDTHYFLVDRFYSSGAATGRRKAENGDA